jgi:hypothetical protein
MVDQRGGGGGCGGTAGEQCPYCISTGFRRSFSGSFRVSSRRSFSVVRTGRQGGCGERLLQQTRLQTQSDPPEQNGRYNDGGGVVPGQLVVACCDTTPILQVREGALDDVASFVCGLVERMPALIYINLTEGQKVGYDLQTKPDGKAAAVNLRIG